MNILLVDDNQYVLEGLLDGIDFSGLGFSPKVREKPEN